MQAWGRIINSLTRAPATSLLVSARIFALINLIVAILSTASADDIVYPPGPTITKDGTTLRLENYANAPHFSRTITSITSSSVTLTISFQSFPGKNYRV